MLIYIKLWIIDIVFLCLYDEQVFKKNENSSNDNNLSRILKLSNLSANSFHLSDEYFFSLCFSYFDLMSSNVRSFFRSDRSRPKSNNLKKTRIQRPTSKSPTTKDHLNDWIPNINSLNSSCCGGDEKKNQSDASRMIKEAIGHTKAIADPMEASDHKIEQIVQQHAPKIEIDDDLKDLFGNKEITKAMINQLAQRALTGPMNSNNDNPPRLCTKKHVRNESR
jgi:hypothetical protein